MKTRPPLVRPLPSLPLLVTVLAPLFAVPPSPLAAQDRVKPSQSGSVSQHVADAVLTIEYDRPVARGRELFGGIVEYGDVWTPGANVATSLEVSREVRLEGATVPAGRYSVWFVPRAEGPWTFVLNTTADTPHFRYPGEDEDLTRIEVEPEEAWHLETLSFYFPWVEGYEATLHFHWGEVVVPLRVEVPTGG